MQSSVCPSRVWAVTPDTRSSTASAASGAALAVSSREPPAESFSSRSSGVSHTTELPLADDEHVVAHGPDLREDVRADDDGVLPGQVPDQIPDLHHLLGVQSHGGLIENDDLGEAQDGLGQATRWR